MRTLVLLPAFNEAATLPEVVSGIRAALPGVEVLVVDDASTDGTGELLAKLGVRRLQLSQRVGVGGAIRSGLRYARLLGAETVVRMDADGQHLPVDVHTLLAPLQRGEADAVVGSRTRSSGGDPIRGHQPLRSGLRWLLGVGLSLLTRRRVTDPTSGFWAFGPAAIRILADHYPAGYSEPELHLFLHRNQLRVREVGVEMRSRRAGRSTLTPGRAALALAKTGLALLVVPLRRAVGGGRDG